MPNLLSALPVVILAWVPASTSGLMRSATFIVRPMELAMAEITSSSAALSTLIWPIASPIASRISRAVLPTPENTMSCAATPPARARRSSPSLVTSAPAPPRAIRFSTAMWSFAFTA